jgi:hypothetical protein
LSDDQLRFVLGDAACCPGCPINKACPAAFTPAACHPDPNAHGRGGLEVIHPRSPDLQARLNEVGGISFEDIKPRPVPPINLPLTTPRVWIRRALHEQLDHLNALAIGADQTILRRLPYYADDVREFLGLWTTQLLVLVLFGKDFEQERMWARRHEFVHMIAEANFDWVLPPSYSFWTDRPWTEIYINLKRSLIFFSLLQSAGVKTAPRFAWLLREDVARAARWFQSNPHVESICLDLAIKGAEFRGQLALLAEFDALTEHRLTYFIHGPDAEARLLPLFALLGNRLHLTGARAISRPPEGLTFSELAEDEWGRAQHSLDLAVAQSRVLKETGEATRRRRRLDPLIRQRSDRAEPDFHGPSRGLMNRR